MQYGFRIGSFRPIASSVMSPNHSSACACPAEVTTHLLNCCDRGETAGPFASPPFPHMHISGLGAIPKSNGKLRIIHDLSPPAGLSVNDGISRDEFSLQYETVDTAISLIMQAGRGALLTKVDIRNAFRLCPVAPCDWPLLGIFWQGQFYHDKVLPFGLRSAPYIFDKFATAVQFILEDACHLSQLLHYLDDFLNVSPPHLPVAEHHRSLILDMLRYLQIPVASEKVEGPSTCLTFLGLELDSLTFEIRLPSAKHGAYLGKVNGLLQSGMASRRELASVLGNLSFAARAIPVGRTFLRRLYDLDRATSNLPKHKVLTLSAGAVNDLKWWQRTLSVWPGKSFFLLDKWTKAPNLQLQTDASGNQGYGAYFQGRWIRGAWLPHQHSESIQYKELYAIVIATSTWASEWKSLRIEFQCDNSAVVDCIKSGTSRSPPMMSLVRCLYHLCVAHDCLISAVHIPGVTNTIADALSRNLVAGIPLPGTHGTAPSGHADLAHTGLTEDVARLASLAIAPSSRRTYSASERRYLDFCQQHGVVALPGSDVTRCYYAALMRTLRPASVRTYMSAIWNLHVEMGLEYPNQPTSLLSRVLRGIARSSGPGRPRLPITTPILRQLCQRLQVSSMRHPVDQAMLQCAFTLAFYGFLRCGELTSLTFGNVALDQQSFRITITLLQSKTDPDGRGTVVHVGGCTDVISCPVTAMVRYLTAVSAESQSPRDQLLVYHNGQPLTRADVTREVRTLLPLCGITDPSSYASHSFRIGAATSAAIAGVPEHVIRHMGRWRSDAVLRYIRVEPSEVRLVSEKLATVSD
eukprot:scpid21606/ scgid26485/ Integrase/recombinase xerD homolog